jgi:CheY-like chemotaxis protein
VIAGAGHGDRCDEDMKACRAIRTIGQARPQSRVDVSGVIIATHTMNVDGSPTVRCLLTDGTGAISLLFLGQATIVGLTAGRRCRAEGMAATYHGRLVIWNPRYTLEPVQDHDRCHVALADYVHKPRALAPVRTLGDLNGTDDAGHHPTISAALPSKRLLVIDDDPGTRKVLAVSLKARGYRVDLASTGSAALELLARETELVVLDLGLPDIYGLDLITAIRDRGDVPIVVISAQDSPHVRTAAMDAGADDYVAKPFAISTLLAAMDAVTSPRG